jgi:hypothetical protein
MHQHVRLLGILNIVYGALIGLLGLVALAVFGGLAGVAGMSGDHDAAAGAGVLAIIGAVIAVVFLVLAAPSIIAGVGVMKYKPWGRILTIVVSALHLLSLPFGTALGIYGLWVLLKPETEAMFQPRPPQAWPARTA